MQEEVGLPQDEAYHRACALFYDTMSFLQTEQRVALEGLLHFGAQYATPTHMETILRNDFMEEQAALKERWRSGLYETES